MQGYYRTKPMLGSIFEPIFLLTYLNICQAEFLYTVSRGINLLNKMLYFPTEASNIKIKGNLCSYFTVKVILKNCWVQGLNCVSLLANPLLGERGCTEDTPWKWEVGRACELKTWLEGLIHDFWRAFLDFLAIAKFPCLTAINRGATVKSVPGWSQKGLWGFHVQKIARAHGGMAVPTVTL